MKKRIGIDPVYLLVRDASNLISQPYPVNITDLVCCIIEKDSNFFQRYESVVKSDGKWSVNKRIGLFTRRITGLKNLGKRSKATSSLIKTYTHLGL